MIIRNLSIWYKDNSAIAAIELGMLMPLMLIILMGMFDTGSAVLASQKVINASQTVSDLLGRYDTVTDTVLDQSVEAGRVMLAPYDTTSYGIDIVGIQFDGSSSNPVEVWRETQNMSPVADAVERATGLGDDNEGVLAVTIKYTYEPFFSSGIINAMDFKETSFVRSRSGLFITRE